ncbi:MAG: hypothetical protein JW894_10000 [Bacteroidales bacterium]|nr:hypothetical protein [Bacteroidales bacterium]
MVRNAFYILIVLFGFAIYGQGQEKIDVTLLDWKCNPLEQTDEFVIVKKKELKSFTACEKKEINLRKKSIIGFSGSVSGCQDPTFEVVVIKNDEEKNYQIDIIVTQYGMCKKLIMYNKVAAVDKFKRGYSVEFETQVKRSEE